MPTLRVLVAIAATGSFSAAAAASHLPQSTVSRRIARLEAAFGVMLLERTTRSVRLTEIGAVVVSAAMNLLRAEDRFFEQVENAATSRVVLLLPSGLRAENAAAIAVRARTRAIPLEVRSAPLEDRRTALHARNGDYVVIPSPAERADWHVPLGFAGPEVEQVPHAYPLELLRPSRGDHLDALAPVIVLSDDAETEAGATIRRHATGVGLGAAQVIETGPIDGLARVIGGSGVICCSEAEAGTWGLAWRPAAHIIIGRHHRLEARNGQLRDTLLAACGADLARALGVPMKKEG
ncbi:LysR family transcriptional regulator [Microbacterium sp. 3J1]|uniref:LysR family transcriptional regulator n=1 Tax=Microbacterium sp. 3J1 TaxID=861269 RepID=UPI000B2D04AC|nr:LysR family transcriptional regulator [Microbacterium sp. 3J1]